MGVFHNYQAQKNEEIKLNTFLYSKIQHKNLSRKINSVLKTT